MKPTNWQDAYFDKEYISFYKDVITSERTAREVDFLVSIFGVDVKRVLDMPCGFGRHAIELGKRGYEVLGVDAYESQLDTAQENSKDVPGVSFVRADMRTFVGSGFDAAISMFSSFGYFSRKEDKCVLRNLVQSVKDKTGLIILDVRNPVRFIQEMSKHDWKIHRTSEAADDIELFDPQTSIHTLQYTRNSLIKTATLNVYTPGEYFQMFTENKCSIQMLYGNYNGEVYEPRKSRRLIVVAQRH